MSLFTQIKTVLWSFIGLAPRGARTETRVSPLVIVVVAFVVVLLFLGTIAFIAHSVVKG